MVRYKGARNAPYAQKLTQNSKDVMKVYFQIGRNDPDSFLAARFRGRCVAEGTASRVG